MRRWTASGIGLGLCFGVATLSDPVHAQGSAGSAPAPAEPSPTESAPTAPAPAAPAPTAPPPAAGVAPSDAPAPPNEAAAPSDTAAPSAEGATYTEPPRVGDEPDAARPTRTAPEVFEPPPPGYGPVYEPPPPPEPKHLAPRNALWVGARVGWWAPFGDAWQRCTAYNSAGCAQTLRVPIRDFIGPGVAVEGNVGARLARAYNVYLAIEHAELGGGSTEFELADNGVVTPMPASRRAASNLYGLGLRFSSDPDRIGLLVDILVGFRRLTAEWDSGELSANAPERLVMTDSIPEVRFGAGADIRVHRRLSLSPLALVGSGTFRTMEWELPDGSRTDAMADNDLTGAHGWFTIGVGGHVDIGGAR